MTTAIGLAGMGAGADRPKAGDRLWLQGIRAYGYTGYFAEEQKLGQWFEVELVLSLDLRSAGLDDRLEATLDYGQIVQQVQNWVQTTQVKTLEALGESLCQRLFQTYGPDSGLDHLRLGLTKCNPPIPHFDGKVTVILERSRLDYSNSPQLSGIA